MILAIIPARAESKRIKNKNIKKFFGKPILSYSISQALKSKIFDKIIVSTDSDKIANISERYGATVMFKRPKKLSGDMVMPISVMAHAIKWIEKNVSKVDYACLIFPTAPMIKSADIVKAYKKIKNENWDYVFSAQKFSFPIQRSFYKKANQSLEMLYKNSYNKRSQDLKEVYRDAGQFYWAKSKTWLSKKKIFANKSTIHLIKNLNGHDVDTKDDWKILEKLYKLKNKI